MSELERTKLPWIGTLVLILLLIAGTFPALDWSYGPGDDPPLAWVFNALFSSGSNAGTAFIFPHGPLAFFLYPTAEHAFIVVLITALLKAGLFFGLLRLVDGNKVNIKLGVAFAVSYAIAVVANFELLVLANVLVCSYAHVRNHGQWCLFYVLILAAFAFFIKAYVAIISLVLLAALAFVFLLRKKFKTVGLIAIAYGSLVLLFRFMIHGTFDGFADQLLGVLQLAGDNSSAVSFYPRIPFTVVLLFPLVAGFYLSSVQRDKGAFAILTVPALFAAWKHGMARADVFHQKGFFIFILMCLLVYTIANRSQLKRNASLFVVVLICVVNALPHSYNYQKPEYQLLRFGNFRNALFSFARFQEASELESRRRISENILSSEMSRQIGEATVDVYPWDLSIIPANGLNWLPRRVIQSYAAYTPWLDEKNASHFDAVDEAPEFIIWHATTGGLNLNASDFNSIDGRYLLNDEPQSLNKLLRNYSLVNEDEKVRLYKRKHTLIVKSMFETKRTHSFAWNTWIAVPEHGQRITKLKLNFERVLFDRLKSFLHKDAQFWMLLRAVDGSIYKHRIVPKNAADGLWVSPYIKGIGTFAEIEAVQFMSSSKTVKEGVIEWMVAADSTLLEPFFGLLSHSTKLIYETENQALTKDSTHSDEFSPPLELRLDTLKRGDYTLQLDAWVKLEKYPKDRSLSLVMEMDGAQAVWKSKAIDEQVIASNRYVHVQHHVKIRVDATATKVKGYLHNPNKLKYHFFDLRLRLLNESE